MEALIPLAELLDPLTHQALALHTGAAHAVLQTVDLLADPGATALAPSLLHVESGPKVGVDVVSVLVFEQVGDAVSSVDVVGRQQVVLRLRWRHEGQGSRGDALGSPVGPSQKGENVRRNDGSHVVILGLGGLLQRIRCMKWRVALVDIVGNLSAVLKNCPTHQFVNGMGVSTKPPAMPQRSGGAMAGGEKGQVGKAPDGDYERSHAHAGAQSTQGASPQGSPRPESTVVHAAGSADCAERSIRRRKAGLDSGQSLPQPNTASRSSARCLDLAFSHRSIECRLGRDKSLGDPVQPGALLSQHFRLGSRQWDSNLLLSRSDQI